MGATQSCTGKQGDNPEAISMSGADTAYKWYGFHILTGTCKSGGAIVYNKILNWPLIALIVVIALGALMMFTRSGARVQFS